MLETVAYWLMGVGLAFDLAGCIGLIRLPDVYNRAQAATKCVTLGTCLILGGTAVLGAQVGNWAMVAKAAICAAFILLTSPVAAHAVLRAAYVSGVPLWDQSVEDAFVQRAAAIRREQAGEFAEESREETETERT
jgi:multicomponent Na+:H+ antiporter subunit G